MSTSDVVGRATIDGQSLSASDQRIAEEAIKLLEGAGDERLRGGPLGGLRAVAYPTDDRGRVGALINKLEAIVGPASGPVGFAKAEDIADRLVEADTLIMNAGPLSLDARARVTKAMAPARAAYHRLMSPGSAAATERERQYEAIRKGAA